MPRMVLLKTSSWTTPHTVQVYTEYDTGFRCREATLNTELLEQHHTGCY